jgi:hypothetical protein
MGDVAPGASHAEVKQQRWEFAGIFEVGWMPFVPNQLVKKRLIANGVVAAAALATLVPARCSLHWRTTVHREAC